MPELPEVETIRRQLNEEISGFFIVGVESSWPKAFQPSLAVVRAAVTGKKIAAIERQAKLLIFRFSPGRSDLPKQRSPLYLLFHLKLTGRLLVREHSAPPDEFTHSVFTLKKDKQVRELRFADARKFGFVRLVRDAREMEELLGGYGPEPFKDLDLVKFRKILERSSRPVKLVLMDQEKLSGIGNIYANEALWLAKIDPRQPSNEISDGRLEELYKAILEVLTAGLKYGGASDSDYVQIHGEKGSYQEHFLVYGKENQPCARCHQLLRRLSLGGRGTFYCPYCQK